MANPFQYGNVVAGPAFCNRRTELRDLRKAIENGDKLFVYSERRLGKTSLVRSALDRLPKRDFIAAYVDLWPTESEADFATSTAKALSMAAGATSKKILDTAKTLFSRLIPSVSVDDDGKPVVSFGVASPRTSDLELDEVLRGPAKLAARQNRRVVVVFDEIQRILEYGDDLVERKLRSVTQHQADVCYLYLGSRKHLVQEMFLDRSRPLYRSAGHYPLGPIDTKHWTPFIGKRFRDARKKIDNATIAEICRLTEGHPFYTQHLCHVVWELTEPGETVTGDTLEDAVRVLLDREGYAYTMLWESLTANQRRFLRGLALESDVVKPFSAAFVQKYGLRTGSNAQRASQALVERDQIDPDNGTFVIVDRFFKLWIRSQQTEAGSTV
jgi:AAA+ ATPase superfamily predicted ATPase